MTAALLTSTGVYEHRGTYCYDGVIDRDTFTTAWCRLGRNYAPALLTALYISGSLDLYQPDMAGVVADVWSAAGWNSDLIAGLIVG